MPLDEALVKAALVAKVRCRKVELQLADAKNEFSQSVRLMHNSGASLRDIAQVLGLSHQRVHQLVGSGGSGAWGRLGWGGKRGMTSHSSWFCSFCSAAQSDTNKLVAGPGVWICERCIASATPIATKRAPNLEDSNRFRLAAPSDHDLHCNFCGRKLRRVASLVSGGSPTRNICLDCLGLCNEVIDARAAGNS